MEVYSRQVCFLFTNLQIKLTTFGYSQQGKRLIARCRLLLAENQDLGKQLSQGRTAQLEAELALQKQQVTKMKASQEGK